jgi:hypothetical protein
MIEKELEVVFDNLTGVEELLDTLQAYADVYEFEVEELPTGGALVYLKTEYDWNERVYEALLYDLEVYIGSVSDV